MVIGVLALLAGFVIPVVADGRALAELAATDVRIESTGTVTQALNRDALVNNPRSPYDTDIAVTRSTVTVADVPASSADEQVVDTRTTDVRTDTGAELAVSGARYAFAPRSSQLVQCCEANVNGNQEVSFTGIVPLKFPFDAAASDYQMFSPVLLAATDVRFVDDVEQYGLKLRQYRQEIPPTQTPAAPLTLPAGLAAGLVGQLAPQLAGDIPAEGEVSLYEFYSAETTFLVEPQTGEIIDTEVSERVTYRLNGGDVDVVTKVAVVMTGADPSAVAAEVAPAARGLVWAERALPLGAGLGLLSIICGVAMIVVTGSKRTAKGRG